MDKKVKTLRKIGVFKIDNHQPTTMKYGFYYDAILTLPFAKDKRHVRVWLPEDYDFDNPNKRFPVLYMSDGQNLVDRHLSAYGDWKLDKVIHQLKEEGYISPILVGIDCPKSPKQRSNELNPPYIPDVLRAKKEIGHPIANEFIDYIVDELKPLIDSLFFTLSDKQHTGIGGSSMGGIMAFYAYMYRYDTFGYSLSFSPAFFFYKKKRWESILDENQLSKDKNGKLFLYVGGKDFESHFTKATINTYEYLREHGFDDNQVALIVDENEIHHEDAWSKYSYDALKFWLKNL